MGEVPMGFSEGYFREDGLPIVDGPMADEDNITRHGNCRCGQVFYTNSNGRERLPHKPGEYDRCKWAGITRETRMCCDSVLDAWHKRPCTMNGPTGPEDVHGGLKRYWAEMSECPSCFSKEPSTFFRGCVGTNLPHVWHRDNGHPSGPTRGRIEVTGHGVVAYDAEGKAVAGFDEDPAKDPRLQHEGSFDYWMARGVRITGDENVPPDRSMYVENWTLGPNSVIETTAGIDYGYGSFEMYKTCCVAQGSGHHPFCRIRGYFTLGQIVDKGYQADPFGPRPMLRMREDPVSNDRTFENETRMH